MNVSSRRRVGLQCPQRYVSEILIYTDATEQRLQTHRTMEKPFLGILSVIVNSPKERFSSSTVVMDA